MDDARPDDISRASEAPATDELASRREAMLKLAKGAAYVAPATLGYLATTRSAAAY